MAQDINLNSNAWCDLVFEGKNKAYGAYNMRQTASRRHLTAFGVVFAALLILTFAPSLLKEAGIGKTRTEGITEANVLSTIKWDKPPIEEEIVLPQPPTPLVELKKTLVFTPPTIVDNETDVSGKEMLAQEEMNKDKTFGISSVAVLEGTTNGIDAAELLGRPTTAGSGTEDGGGAPELIPDIPAKFLGGDAELMMFLRENIRYPHIAIESQIQGRTVVRFVVSIDGSISDVKVIKSSDPALDKEAVRVVRSMPKWVPGKKNGKNVNSYFTLPVTFKLN